MKHLYLTTKDRELTTKRTARCNPTRSNTEQQKFITAEIYLPNMRHHCQLPKETDQNWHITNINSNPM